MADDSLAVFSLPSIQKHRPFKKSFSALKVVNATIWSHDRMLKLCPRVTPAQVARQENRV